MEEKLESREEEPEEEINPTLYEFATKQTDGLIDSTVFEEISEIAQSTIIQEKLLLKPRVFKSLKCLL